MYLTGDSAKYNSIISDPLSIVNQLGGQLWSIGETLLTFTASYLLYK